MRRAVAITLSEEEKTALNCLVRFSKTTQRLVEHTKIVLAAGAGKENQTIAAELKCSQERVRKWRNRFASMRLAGIKNDSPRSGRPPVGRSAKAKEIAEKTLKTKPKGQTHWSTRGMAKAVGVGRM